MRLVFYRDICCGNAYLLGFFLIGLSHLDSFACNIFYKLEITTTKSIDCISHIITVSICTVNPSFCVQNTRYLSILMMKSKCSAGEHHWSAKNKFRFSTKWLAVLCKICHSVGSISPSVTRYAVKHNLMKIYCNWKVSRFWVFLF